MCGVAQERQATEAPSRQRILINHRIFENCFGAADELWHVKPIELPIRHRGQKVLQAPATIPIARVVVRCLDVAYPIHKLAAVGIDIDADRIDKKLRRIMPDNADKGGATSVQFQTST